MSPLPWFRWHVGTVTDIKWPVIAGRANTSIANVLGVWTCLLEAAAQSEYRGAIESWCAEDIAAHLGIEHSTVERIWDAMQGKVLTGQQLTGWEKRQPKREDDSASRTRKWRHEKNVTQCDAERRIVTPRVEESRVEEITTNPLNPPFGGNGKLVSELPPTDPPGSSKRTAAARRSLVPTADEEAVFAYYRERRPRFRGPDDAQIRSVRKALERYSAEECCQMIDGNHADDWAIQAKKHEITWIFRNNDTMTKYLEASIPVILVGPDHELTDAGRRFFAGSAH